MFERFTRDARTVVVHAQEHARRLGHRYVGCEHLLLALVSTGQPAGAVLRQHGVTPERVEEEIVRRVGLGAGAGLFADLDKDALASIGIDLDAVRARIEASFGPDALTQASQAVHGRPRPSRLNPRRAVPPGLVRRWQRWRRARRAVPASAARSRGPRSRRSLPGHRRPPPRAHPVHPWRQAELAEHRPRGAGPPGHPHRPRARRTRPHRHEERAGASYPSALGASAPTLRAAILDCYRQAS